MKVRTTAYGGYLVKVGVLNGTWTARAFAEAAASRGGIVAETTGPTPDAAEATLCAELDRKRVEVVRARRIDGNFAVPTVEEYERALASLDRDGRLTAEHRLMLKTHAEAGDAGLSETDIASAAGYDRYNTANASYGRLGRMLGAAIGVTAPDTEVRPAGVPTRILAEESATRDPKGHFVWIMHRELRAALERLSQPG